MNSCNSKYQKIQSFNELNLSIFIFGYLVLNVFSVLRFGCWMFVMDVCEKVYVGVNFVDDENVSDQSEMLD